MTQGGKKADTHVIRKIVVLEKIITIKDYFLLPISPELVPHHKIQFSFIPRMLFLVGGHLPFCSDTVSIFINLTTRQQERWTIGMNGEKESKEYMLPACFDDEMKNSKKAGVRIGQNIQTHVSKAKILLGSLWPRFVEPIRVPFIGHLKIYSCVKISNIT